MVHRGGGAWIASEHTKSSHRTKSGNGWRVPPIWGGGTRFQNRVRPNLRGRVRHNMRLQPSPRSGKDRSRHRMQASLHAGTFHPSIRQRNA